MFFQRSLGIHIENSVVTIALVRTSLKGARLTASEVRPLDVNAPVKDRVKIISETVNEFLRRYGVSPANTFLAIPRDRVILRNISLPPAVKENLRGALGYEMEKYVPFASDDVFFDFQLLRETKEPSALEILIAVARKDDVAPYLGLKGLIGRDISGVEISSTAIANFLSHIRSIPADNFCTLLYLAEDYFEVGLIRGGLLEFSRRYAFPANHHFILNEICKGLEQARKVFLPKEESNGVVALCGPGASEPISNGLREEGYTIQEVDRSVAGLPSSELMPAFGLALKGLNGLPNQMNLLPVELQKRAGRMGYYLMIILLIMTFLGGLGWWGSRIQQQRLFVQDLEREGARLRPQVAKSDEIQKRYDGVRGKIRDLISVSARGIPVVDILKELSERVPQDAWLIEMSLSKDRVVITGYANRASDLIPVLEASPLFRNVVFLSTITKTREGKEQFRIGFKAG